jgi:3',5'-cyclic AMP phosphodiesterase CpdA
MNYRFSRYVLIALFLLNFACNQPDQKPFTFVQLCDTQLGFNEKSYEQDLINFKQAVEQINALNPDFVVICGDLVNNPGDSSYSDFLGIKKELKMPCYSAPGNHDVGNMPNEITLSYYRKTIGQDYYDFDHKGYSFIVTNSQLWKSDIGTESEKQNNWFKETLQNQRLKSYPVFVIGHYPLYTKSPQEEEHYFNFPAEKREELLNLFLENNVVAYLSGHTHEVVINNFKNIQLVSGETTSRNFDKRPFGYRVWEISTDTIQQHFVPLQLSTPSQSEPIKQEEVLQQ